MPKSSQKARPLKFFTISSRVHVFILFKARGLFYFSLPRFTILRITQAGVSLFPIMALPCRCPQGISQVPGNLNCFSLRLISYKGSFLNKVKCTALVKMPVTVAKGTQKTGKLSLNCCPLQKPLRAAGSKKNGKMIASFTIFFSFLLLLLPSH